MKKNILQKPGRRNETMTVKDVAERAGLTVYTIRYYAREGLLPSVRRDKNGARIFTEGDLESIYIIECLKNCGMSIQEIRDFTQWTIEGDTTIDQRLSLFREKHMLLQEKIQRMQETLEALEYKVWFYETAKQAGSVSVHDTMKAKDVPLRMREIRARMKHVEHLAKSKELLARIEENANIQTAIKAEKE